MTMVNVKGVTILTGESQKKMWKDMSELHKKDRLLQRGVTLMRELLPKAKVANPEVVFQAEAWMREAEFAIKDM